MKSAPKPAFLIFTLVLAGFLSSCHDNCKTTYSYKSYEPVYKTVAEVRNSVAMRDPEQIGYPGKIYLLGNYLFINEVGRGIHVFDNFNPAKPVNKSFLNIPGNYDMAATGSVLYADSYVDLLVFDLSDLNDIKLIKRLDGVFQDSYSFMNDQNGNPSILTDWVEKDVQTIYNECDGIMPSFNRGGFFPGAKDQIYMAVDNYAPSSIAPGGSNNGIGGSMARFTIVNQTLYTVGTSRLNVFDIFTPGNPVKLNTVEINWGIETIFPYKNNIFIGANNGMHIYDVSDPSAPQYVSTFAHVRSCDPVVVNDSIAFVTLRSGTTCEGFSNQLDIIDIKNLANPLLIKSYPMLNPHGLGLDSATLFICEGSFGLKVYDASDIYNIDQHQLKFIENVYAFDVIPYNKILLLTGEDGLYQYDYTNISDIKLLSQISIVPATK
jgi:hypothetical protein